MNADPTRAVDVVDPDSPDIDPLEVGTTATKVHKTRARVPGRFLGKRAAFYLFTFWAALTINFFLPSCPSESEVLTNYNNLVRQTYKCFTSRSFQCSRTLFPSKDMNSILIYFPCSIKIGGYSGKDVYLWQVKDRNSVFFVIFENEIREEELTVKIYSSMVFDESYHSLFAFILNCLAHILAQADLK